MDAKEKILATKGSYNYSSIDELSDEMLGTIINNFEQAYTKDSMTNGILPKLNIIKAIYRQFLNDNNKNSQQFTFEEFTKIMKNIKIMMKLKKNKLKTFFTDTVLIQLN